MGMLVPQEGYFVVTFISVTVVLFFFFLNWSCSATATIINHF